MAVHVDFQATAGGSTWRNVTCEKCKKPYHYALVREAKASVRAAYALRQNAAEDRAEKTAEYRLMQLLEKGVDLVPCPACGWVQEEMVAEGKRRTARWLIFLAGLCAIAGLAMAMMPMGELMFVAEPEVTPAEKTRAIIGAILGFGGPVACLVLRWMIQSRVNPNANYPKMPKPIPGMPVGIPGKAPRGQFDQRGITGTDRSVSIGNGLIG